MSKEGRSAFVSLFRNVLRSPFANDSGNASSPSRGLARASTSATAASTDTAATTTATPSLLNLHIGERPSPPPLLPSEHQPLPQLTQNHFQAAEQQATSAVNAAVQSVDESADLEPADALTLAQEFAGLDTDAPLDARLAALQSLVLELRCRPVVSIAGLWRVLAGTVNVAFADADEAEQGVAPPSAEQRADMRVLVLGLIASFACTNPNAASLGGGDSAQTRQEMLDVLAAADGWEEIALAAQSAVWASDCAPILPGDAMVWLKRAQGWVTLAASRCYPENSAGDPSQAPPEDASAALTAAIEFLSRTIGTEYPILDPDFISDITQLLCTQAAQTRPVSIDGMEEVAWVWTEPVHLYGVLHLLKTVIKYGALSQEVLGPGIMLMCTTVKIPECERICREIAGMLFTSCYMRDALLSMNLILSMGNTELNTRHIYTVSMTVYEAAVNGIVYFITQVMDTGPTGFQFSLRTGSCLPVLSKAAQSMHPDVLQMVLPYLCKIVNDDRAESMLPDDWNAVLSILLTTVSCRLDSSTLGETPDVSPLSYQYDCALQSVVGFFSRESSLAPIVLIRLLYDMREVLSDDIAQSMLRFMEARGSLRPGATSWAAELEVLMHLYYFDRSRSIALRRYMVRLCSRAFVEAAEISIAECGSMPIMMSVLEQLRLEDDDKVVDSVLEILSILLRRTRDSATFRRTLKCAINATVEPEFSRSTQSSQSPQQFGANAGDTSPTHHAFQPTLSNLLPLAPVGERVPSKDEQLFPSYRRIRSTIRCLLDVLEWRITITDIASERRYAQNGADSVELTHRLLDLLEEKTTFHSVQRDILSLFLRLHADSSLKLYVMHSDRDTIMDQRVSLYENARLRLVASSGDDGRGGSDGVDAPFPTNRYVRILADLVRTNIDFDTHCELCHGLMIQLGNTYLFSVCADEVQALVNCLIGLRKPGTYVYGQDLSTQLSATDKTKASTCLYGLFISVMHYKDLLTRDQQNALIINFRSGLIVASGALATPQICLHALTIGMLELPGVMVRLLPSALTQLAKVHSAAQFSLHLLEFVSSMSREKLLYANFQLDEYRMLFTVAVNYIRFHNNQRRRDVAALSTSPDASRAAENAPPTKTLVSDAALNQYVFVMAYQVIDFYYLSLKPAIKAEVVHSLVAGLLQSNYSRDHLDEANEVCVDMIMQNYRRTSEEVMNQEGGPAAEDLGPVVERSWIQHNGIVTIRAQVYGQMAQIIVRSPSGTTSTVVDLPAELKRKQVERADHIALSPPASPVTDSPTSTIGPSSSRSISRGGSIGRNRRIHSVTAQGPIGPGTEADMLPIGSVARLLRGELRLQSDMGRATRLPIKFGLAPCLAQDFITAYQGLVNIDPPKMLPVQSEAIARSLRVFDNTSTIDTHKVSVVYVGPGQTTEREILLNQQGSPAYWNFLRGLGNITRLSGLKGFSAGLDTSGNDSDGRYTIRWRDLIAQLVFHVGTLMPAREDKQEQIVRKKAHMGNDYVQIVFNESGRDYEFDTIPSQFNYVQIIVTPVDGRVPSHEEDSSWLHNKSADDEPRFVQLYKVRTQVNPNVPFVGPAMEPKLLTLTALSAFVRSIGIHAAILSQVFTSYNVADVSAAEFVSPWRARLRTIKRVRATAERENLARSSPPSSAQDTDELGDVPDDLALVITARQALGFLIGDLEASYGSK
ncbi:Tuberous sclerosis 2-like protein [Coemansia sp. RSA 2322]|uniref:Tuberous sclerosis 2-like protein n=1 Tax=Coemansia thaxteri TaxID=2663907 RepID=A0A9W8EE81_9FUNG|nr:Tuberous sclerosis 2-like protein [Coemansia thaxteri]KAJ2471418.1 Tuberous sclerosis 2-like protein [Coemansia sp. RSA 2322]KAJ2484677.1 Tuberous sclerosis 2-like protein [Coemansia sp. RSA 2320]